MHTHELNLVSQILERLSKIGEISGVNAVSGDNSCWLMDQWVKHDEFLEKLGDRFPRRANVVVKMNSNGLARL